MLKHLLVISHTEHFLDAEGRFCGWGSTVTELNYLAEHWERITHIACFHEGESPPNALPYTAPNIEFIAIPPFGGKGFMAKLGILTKMPRIISTIKRSLKSATEVQLRLPTGMGVVLLPWFSIRRRNYLLWVKYAGNWAHSNPPFGYRFQRWWLKRNLTRCKVTINGRWPGQPPHCKSFENPCLFESEVEQARKEIAQKSYNRIEACFVGRLSANKGIFRILDVLKSEFGKTKLVKFHIVGDGPLRDEILAFAVNSPVSIEVHGFLPREKITEIYRKSQLIFLPSDSEGFPKVIAEAMCYGCVPIVSDVSSIGQYVNETNGYLWDIDTDFSTFFNSLDLSEPTLKNKAGQAYAMVAGFTFESYFQKLQKNVFLKK